MGDRRVVAADGGQVQVAQALQASHSKFLVDDIGARMDRGQERGGSNWLAPGGVTTFRPAKDLGISEDLEGQVL